MRVLIHWEGPPDTFREWIKKCADARLPVICWLSVMIPVSLPLPVVCQGVECVIARRPTPQEVYAHRQMFSGAEGNMFPYVFETPYFFTDEELFREKLGQDQGGNATAETPTKVPVTTRNAESLPDQD